MLSVLLKPLLFTVPRRSATATAAVRGMSSSLDSEGLTQRMFQLKVDPLTGKSEWVVIEEDEEDIGNQITPKALLAATSYLDMLNDARRNRAFRQAIDQTVTGPCHVLDIGAGTGLLSMMAARAMGLSDSKGSSGLNGMVTACESYLPMVKLMKKVLRANGMDGKIRIINKRSDELDIGVDIPSRADVLVSEILDSELLGEGLIPTLQHAHDKLLIEYPQTVPYRATIYGQMHDLVNREAGVSDGIRLVPNGMFDLLGIKKQQYAMHCNSMKEGIKLLSEPFKVFDFDFWRRPDSSRETELHIKATNDGTVHAIISWWLLQLDSEGTIFYSTGPDWIHSPSDLKELNSSFPSSGNWCDHWKQSVWFTSSSGLHVFKDEEVWLHAVHTETSISYQFETSQDKKSVTRRDLCIRDCEIVLPPERIALYGDNCWRCLMLNAIGKALRQRVHQLCLVADDSIFLAIAVAHLSKSSHVIPLFPGLGKKGSEYLQRVAAANNYTMDRIEVLKKKDLQSALQDSNQRKISLFVAEPFYYGNDSVLPWQNLRFWKDRTLLDSVLSKDVLIMPCRGLLRACAMYLPDLWRSRCCLKEVEGFDHSAVNTTLGGCGGLPYTEEGPFLPFFIWQCGDTKILSETTTILEFDFSKPMNSCSGKTQVQFRESGMCHGFVLWIDWVLDAEDNTVLSTGPDKRHWKQAVKLLNEPVEVGNANIFSTEIEAFFDPSNGELSLKHAFVVKQR
ncbi:UNVERIFIED_CONTAM: protein arginine N-methyltransferase 1.6 [Sesamum latifolium]|uniref:Protein arginine N-methyltransferase 1.6 n=1 Tax=Sesamum latifolium TaxID=2727402 RepID=A0AAW2SS17_9LAMI